MGGGIPGSLKAPQGPSRPLKAPQGLSRPFTVLHGPARALQAPQRPFTVPHGPSRPLKPPHGPSRTLKAPQGPSSPLKTPQGPQGPSSPFKPLQGPARPLKGPQGPSRPLKTPQGPSCYFASACVHRSPCLSCFVCRQAAARRMQAGMLVHALSQAIAGKGLRCLVLTWFGTVSGEQIQWESLSPPITMGPRPLQVELVIWRLLAGSRMHQCMWCPSMCHVF